MGAVDYYWMKAGEALEKAEASPNVKDFFVSIALVYRALATDEDKIRSRFPTISPRLIAPKA